MFAEHLVHTAEIYRRPDPQTDRFGQPVEPDEDSVPIGTHVARLTVAKGGEQFNDRSRDVVKTTHNLFLPLGADVIEADRITVKDEEGKTLVDKANALLVTEPRDWRGPHHVEVKLQDMRAGDDPSGN